MRKHRAIVIQPTRGPVPPRLTELWSYRELFGFLVWRDIKVRYAQTVIGAAWTVFQPLAMMVVYTFAFTQLARVDTGTVPYALYALSGLVIWMFVSRSVSISHVEPRERDRDRDEDCRAKGARPVGRDHVECSSTS